MLDNGVARDSGPRGGGAGCGCGAVGIQRCVAELPQLDPEPCPLCVRCSSATLVCHADAATSSRCRPRPPSRRSAVQQLCAAEDSAASEQGLVYKCLVSHYMDVDEGCQKELGRAVHMAFFVWKEGAILTSECDADVKTLCLASRPNMATTPGAVGQCLAAKVGWAGKEYIVGAHRRCKGCRRVRRSPCHG